MSEISRKYQEADNYVESVRAAHGPSKDNTFEEPPSFNQDQTGQVWPKLPGYPSTFLPARDCLAINLYNGTVAVTGGAPRPKSQILKFDPTATAGSRWTFSPNNALDKPKPYIDFVMDEAR